MIRVPVKVNCQFTLTGTCLHSFSYASTSRFQQIKISHSPLQALARQHDQFNLGYVEP